MIDAGLTGCSVMVHSTSDPSANDLGIVTSFRSCPRALWYQWGLS